MLLVFSRCCQEDYAYEADSTGLSGAMIIFRKHSNNFTFFEARERCFDRVIDGVIVEICHGVGNRKGRS